MYIYSVYSRIELKLIIVTIAAAVPFMFSLNGDFVFDDSEAITKNKDVKANKFYDAYYSDFWGTNIMSNISHKSYRPLTINTFRLNYILSGYQLIPHHFKITNLLCHVLCSVIVFFTYKIMIDASNTYKYRRKHDYEDCNFLAALLFAVHPVHTEAVSGIVGRADILAAVTYFTTFICYHYSMTSQSVKEWILLLLSVILAFVSMLFKENGITVLGFCVIYEVIVNKDIMLFCKKMYRIIWKRGQPLKHINIQHLKNSLWRVLIILGSSVIFLFVRWLIMGRSIPQFKPIDNPTAFSENLFIKIATYNYLYFLNVLLLIWPQWLCYDWSMGCVPLITHLCDFRLIFVLLFYSFCIMFAAKVCYYNRNRSERRLTAMACASMLVPFLPAANIFLTVGFVLAERVLYIPSAGYCLLIAIGIKNISRRKYLKKITILLFSFLLIVYGLRSAQRAVEWQNEYQLFTSGLRVCPLNAKVHYNVAKVADSRSLTEWSLAEYKEAIRLYPEYYQAMNNLANLLKNQNKYDEAEKYLKKALEIKADFPAAWMNLGIVYASTGRHLKSEVAYKTAIEYRLKYPACYFNLGNLYLDMNKTKSAVTAWNEAIRMDPKHVLAWTNLLALLDNEGELQKALEIIPSALNELPDAPAIHFATANIYGKLGYYEKAEYHFMRSIQLFGGRVKALHHANFGVLYHRWKKYKLAQIQYKKALQIEPGFTSALNNIKSLQKFL